MRTPIALLLILSILTASGVASAHKTYPTDDGKYLITVGNLGEPVYTYQKSGLDLIIRTNDTARTEVGGVNGTLNATLIGPGGEELKLPLQVQHGAVGRYSFVKGYTLTQPGMYRLKLVGSINGTAVDGLYDMPHEIESQAEIMFPAKGLPTLQELDARVKSLEGKVSTNGAPPADRNVPGFGPAFGLLALAGVATALALRRRA